MTTCENRAVKLIGPRLIEPKLFGPKLMERGALRR